MGGVIVGTGADGDGAVYCVGLDPVRDVEDVGVGRVLADAGFFADNERAEEGF